MVICIDTHIRRMRFTFIRERRKTYCSTSRSSDLSACPLSVVSVFMNSGCSRVQTPLWPSLCLCCSDRSEPSVGSSKAVCNTSSFILNFYTHTHKHYTPFSLTHTCFVLSCHVLCCAETGNYIAWCVRRYQTHTGGRVLYSLMYCLITLIFIRS